MSDQDPTPAPAATPEPSPVDGRPEQLANVGADLRQAQPESTVDSPGKVPPPPPPEWQAPPQIEPPAADDAGPGALGADTAPDSGDEAILD